MILLVVSDFAQWLIHNLLHRVPWLWRIHQVHHSLERMDWLGNWRIHFGEMLIYRILMYPLAAWVGFSGEAMFANGVVNTFISHLAHANVRWRLGALKYLINTPEMHVWHHAHPEAGPVDRNFGVALSVWDWLFRTAYAPGRDPARLGFAGVERYPKNIVTQAAAPFQGLPG